MVVDFRVNMDWPRKDGTTKRATILGYQKSMPPEVFERQFGKQIIEPEFNPNAGYLLDLFFELSNSRQAGMGGPLPISFLEIDAYKRISDVEIEPWEVKIIKELDESFLVAASHTSKE